MGKPSTAKVIIPLREMKGRDGGKYYIGNCELNVKLENTVLFVFLEGDAPKIVVEPKMEMGPKVLVEETGNE